MTRRRSTRGPSRPRDFRERFKSGLYDHALSTSVAEVVDDHDKLEPERRKLILEFWADAPDDANDVNPGILQAFALQPLLAGARPGGGRPAGGDHPSRGGGPRPAKPPKPRQLRGTALAAKIQRVEEWGARSNQVLPQEIARDLRGRGSRRGGAPLPVPVAADAGAKEDRRR